MHLLIISDGRPSYVADYEEVKGPKPNLYRTVIKTFWVYWAEATTFMLIGQVSWLLQPLILRYSQISVIRTSIILNNWVIRRRWTVPTFFPIIYCNKTTYNSNFDYPSHQNTSFECLKYNFMIEEKQPKPRFGCIKGPSHRDGSFKHPNRMGFFFLLK